MTVLINKTYKGVPAGNIAQFVTSEETALKAQGLASTTALDVTAGAATQNSVQGRCAVAAAATSVVITNSQVDASTRIHAVISQAAADATALYVARVVPAAGSFTIYVNAAATADTFIDWVIVNPIGLTSGTH